MLPSIPACPGHTPAWHVPWSPTPEPASPMLLNAMHVARPLRLPLARALVFGHR